MPTLFFAINRQLYNQKFIALMLLGLLMFVFNFMPMHLTHAQTNNNTELLKKYQHYPLGSTNAKVMVYEFVSLTCGHCADFQLNVLPNLKTNYIDKGLVQMQVVDFPLDNVAFGAAVLSRCLTDSKRYHAFLNELFKNQRTWAGSQNPKAEIFKILAQAGVSTNKAEACLKNENLINAVRAGRQLGDTIGISGTPSIFVDGKPTKGNDLKSISKAIEQALKNQK